MPAKSVLLYHRIASPRALDDPDLAYRVATEILILLESL